MCVGVNNQQAAAPYQAYFAKQAPNSRFANSPGASALFGAILSRHSGGQSTSAAQPRQQYTGG